MNPHSLRKIGSMIFLVSLVMFLGSGTAYAHHEAGSAHDLWHGVNHPLTGLDHICAMFAVGLWAAQRGGRELWAVPLTFVLVMTLGFALGMSGISLPLVEQGIVVSVLVLGLLIAAAVRLPLAISAMIVGVFALVHGHAHGTELLTSANAMNYAAGFIMATALLHVAGISFGFLSQRRNSSQLGWHRRSAESEWTSCSPSTAECRCGASRGT